MVPERLLESVAAIDTLMDESRLFKPSASFAKTANAKKAIYAQADKNSVTFWESLASELVWRKNGVPDCIGKRPTQSGS